jgi:tetraacyldisaccharide 4'-kinase
VNIDSLWYQKNVLAYGLWPFSGLYRAVMAIRRWLYRSGIKKTVRFPAPVIVVGNITVGGAGKTPLVIYLANQLQQNGWRPGIVSRGYGGTARSPQIVTQNSDPRLVGDEAVLIVQKAACPVVVGRDRPAAVAVLLREHDCDIVISDDGLQHLALARDMEIAVFDGERRLGNGFCLPAGPLREPRRRLKTVDFIIGNGSAGEGEWLMTLSPKTIYQLMQPSRHLTFADIQGKTVHAVAGIGHPTRFFNTLKQLGCEVIPHPFPDHYDFQKQDLVFNDDKMVIMTEKDAVKCRAFADSKLWCLSVDAELSPQFLTTLQQSPKLAQEI